MKRKTEITDTEIGLLINSVRKLELQNGGEIEAFEVTISGIKSIVTVYLKPKLDFEIDTQDTNTLDIAIFELEDIVKKLQIFDICEVSLFGLSKFQKGLTKHILTVLNDTVIIDRFENNEQIIKAIELAINELKGKRNNLKFK